MQARDFRPGMTVVCNDNQNVEHFVSKDRTYQVAEIQHRGVLLKIEGVNVSLASSRFTPTANTPPTQEVIRGSN
jgi:hypothetical protein